MLGLHPEECGVALHRTRQAGSNAFIESFNSKLRGECLNEYVFTSLAEARAIIEAWRLDYNDLRPHSSLGALTQSEFAALKRDQATPPQEGKITGVSTYDW